MSGKSLNTITKTGTYIGGNIPELIPYVGSSAWCIIQANVQTDNAATFDVITSTGSIINIYRENGTYKFYHLALKSDLTDIIMVKSFQGTSITIAENASEKVSIPISTPTGYKVVGKISERWNGGPEMYLSQVDLTPTTFTGFAANLRNSEATSIPTISVLFVKS